MMGRVERMMLNFCRGAWDAEDEVTRHRIVRRRPRLIVPPSTLLPLRVWRCFYRRHPEAMREASAWSGIASRFLSQFEAEDAAANAMNAINQVLK